MIDSIIQKHKKDRNYIRILQSIQDAYGYVPEKETAAIAKDLGLPLVKLWGVATFYSQFKLKKEGEIVIQVCDGTACHVNHSLDLIKVLEGLLEIKAGETTKDGKVTLEAVNCIGACAKAPAIMVNGQVFGNLDKKSIIKIIKGFINQ